MNANVKKPLDDILVLRLDALDQHCVDARRIHSCCTKGFHHSFAKVACAAAQLQEGIRIGSVTESLLSWT